jgi:hypothetical protein
MSLPRYLRDKLDNYKHESEMKYEAIFKLGELETRKKFNCKTSIDDKIKFYVKYKYILNNIWISEWDMEYLSTSKSLGSYKKNDPLERDKEYKDLYKFCPDQMVDIKMDYIECRADFYDILFNDDDYMDSDKEYDLCYHHHGNELYYFIRENHQMPISKLYLSNKSLTNRLSKKIKKKCVKSYILLVNGVYYIFYFYREHTNKSKFSPYFIMKNMNYVFNNFITDVSTQKIRSKEYKSRSFPPSLRILIFENDNYTCKICNKHKDKLPESEHLEIDHIVEWEDGGKTSYNNGQTVCSSCNKGKHHAKKKLAAINA